VYRFEETISSAVEEDSDAPPPQPSAAEGPLSAEDLAAMDRYWRASTYPQTPTASSLLEITASGAATTSTSSSSTSSPNSSG
jgi:hypothetical protein